jgi:hypothetical protein
MFVTVMTVACDRPININPSTVRAISDVRMLPSGTKYEETKNEIANLKLEELQNRRYWRWPSRITNVFIGLVDVASAIAIPILIYFKV